jgi:hypothetical protein
MKQAGIPIPDEQLIEASTLQNKKKLIDAITQSNQAAQQQQQQQAQVQMQELQARAELAHARAQADYGLSVERAHEAEKDDKAALLNLVKALKEIDSMDLSHIEQLIRMSQTIQVKDDQIGATIQNATQQPTQGAQNAQV